MPLAVRTPDGAVACFGLGAPLLEVRAANERGMAALRSLSELRIVDAYLREDLDLDGDLIAAMDLREHLFDIRLFTRAWALLQPLLFRRRRLNPDWVAKHYDSENVQLFAIDESYNVYTPGIYQSEEDSLEEGAERKLEFAFRSLRLGPGRSLLDVGCGWGGFASFCATRGVETTGISLSRHQLDVARRRLDRQGLEAELLYQDFFTYEPQRRFDAISLMGSIEELSDYQEVMRRIAAWLEPGGRVYLDFASVDRPFGIASFVTRYVWPGPFRMVYLPGFTRALARQHFDVLEMHSDRRNYYLWAKQGYERWMRRRDEILAVADERIWRLMRVLMAGTAHLMSPRSTKATAYRVVLEPRRSAVPAAAPASALVDTVGQATR